MNSIVKLSATLGVLFFATLLSGEVEGMGTSQRLPQIRIEAQEARLSTVIIGSSSVFMKISNTGNMDDTLVGAKVDIPAVIVEIHDTDDGKMIKKEKLRIPPSSVVELKPGGLHIMLFKMPEDIKEGSEFRLRLIFEKSGEMVVDVKLKGVDTHMHMHH